jgi:acetylornithine deacetylase/succinyl-diaminopimelate desuccinylase-like protein
MTAALQVVDATAVARDASRLVRVPSITGDERAAAAEIVAMAQEYGLDAELVEFDLGAMRAAAGYPGEEAPRTGLVGAIVTLRGADPAAPRLCLNGHIDVVRAGTEPWQRDPWSGEIADGAVHGRGAVDMKGGVAAALHAHERAVNARPRHPLLAEQPLPYPLLVGQLQAGRWSSQVPEELRFEGRLGVPVGEPLDEARTGLEHAIEQATDDLGPPVEIAWTGGQFASGETAVDDRWVRLVRDAGAAELGTPPELVGVGYGADMRLFCQRGIPCVLFGPRGLRLAHAVDERVEIADLTALARIIVRCALAFGRR